MRRPLSGSGSGSLAASSTAASASAAAAGASGYAAARVDLPSTLSTFGSPSAFNVSSYLTSVYSSASPAAAVHHRAELMRRREQTSEELRAYVTRHYSAFIDTTASILTIESDMSQLSSMLAAFASHLTAMQAPALAYQDDGLARRGKEREREALAARAAQLSAQQALEDWNEDLRSTIYERKFERAVRIIEKAWQQRGAGLQDESAPSRGNGAASSDIDAMEAEMEKRVTQLVETLTAELQSAAIPREHCNGLQSACQTPSLIALLCCRCWLYLRVRSASLKRYERRRIINWLVRLDEAEAALEIYLQHRSALLEAAIRSIKLSGDLALYIQELSSLVFSHLAVTCKDALQLFTDDRSRQSAVMLHCQQLLAAFASRLSKQLFSSHSQFAVIGACLRAAFSCCQAIEAQGLSLSFPLARLLSPPLCDCIERHCRQAERAVLEQLKEEEWRVSELWVHDKDARRRGPAAAASSASASASASQQLQPVPHHHRKRSLKLTPSAKCLYDTIRSLLKDLMPLLDSQHLSALHSALYSPIVSGLISLFERYLLQLAAEFKRGMNAGLDDLQSLSIVADCFYLADDLLPRVGREFRRQFGLVVLPELEEFGSKLGRLYEALQDAYCHKRTQHWLQQQLAWTALCDTTYTNPNPLPLSSTQPPASSPSASSSAAATSRTASSSAALSSLSVSPGWLRVHEYFIVLRAIICKCLSSRAVPVVLSACLEELLAALLSEAYWPQLRLGYGGLLQLTRDLTFFVTAVAAFETDTLSSLRDELLSRARRDFCQLTQRESEDEQQEVQEAQEAHARDVSERMQRQEAELQTISSLEQQEQEKERQRERQQSSSRSRPGKERRKQQLEQQDGDHKENGDTQPQPQQQPQLATSGGSSSSSASSKARNKDRG